MSISSIREAENFISAIAPAGYYVGLRVGFFAPEIEINTFPAEWVEKYTIEALALADPLRYWALTNIGFTRWSSINGFSTNPVLELYAEFGCRYGVAIAISGKDKKAKRSIAYFARMDREMTDEEIKSLYGILFKAHGHDKKLSLTKAQAEALRLFASGLRHKQIAHELQISESAVKARLKSAMERMGAKTTAQTASIASQKGLI